MEGSIKTYDSFFRNSRAPDIASGWSVDKNTKVPLFINRSIYRTVPLLELITPEMRSLLSSGHFDRSQGKPD